MAAFVCEHNCTQVAKVNATKSCQIVCSFIKINNKMKNIDNEKDNKLLFSSFLFTAGVAYLGIFFTIKVRNNFQ